MKPLQHLIEPERLWVTWQCPGDNQPRDRRIVAEVTRQAERYHFTYLVNSEDYHRATETGFRGYPSFDPQHSEHHIGVMEALVRRLPPRKREDFSDYLQQFQLPTDFSGSDFALLGYTGGKLPSDTFGFVPDFRGVVLPIEVIIEVAGARYHTVGGLPTIGTRVQFLLEPNNQAEPNAVAIMDGHTRLGYINRALRTWFADCIAEGRAIYGEVTRLNGKPERPIIYVYTLIE